MSQTIDSTPSLSHKDNTGKEDRAMPTCFGAEGLIARLESYPTRRIKFESVEGGDGPTSLAKANFYDSTKVSLLARRRLPTEDSARESLPHTTTALPYTLAKVTNHVATGTSRPLWTVCAIGVVQDRIGSSRQDPNNSNLGWSKPSVELIAGKIDGKDLSKFPDHNFDDPKERNKVITISSNLREMEEEGGLTKVTCETVKVLGMTPVTHKDAGLTNATNTRVTTLSTLKMPVEELPPSKNLSETESEQGLCRWTIPMDELSDALSQVTPELANVDTQLVDMAAQYELASKCRTGGIRDVVQALRDSMSRSSQSEYTQADLLSMIAHAEERATQGYRDIPSHWFTEALDQNVELSKKHASSLGVTVG